MVAACLIEHSQPRVIGAVHFPLKAFLSGKLADFADADLAEIDVIVVEVWLCATPKADVSGLAQRTARVAVIASKFMHFGEWCNILRLNIATEAFDRNSFPLSCEQHAVFLILKVMSLFRRLFLNAANTAKVGSFLPFQPIVRET